MEYESEMPKELIGRLREREKWFQGIGIGAYVVLAVYISRVIEDSSLGGWGDAVTVALGVASIGAWVGIFNLVNRMSIRQKQNIIDHKIDFGEWPRE